MDKRSGRQRMFPRWSRRASGQGLIEYAILVALVVSVAVLALVWLGPAVGQVLSRVMTVFIPGPSTSEPAAPAYSPSLAAVSAERLDNDTLQVSITVSHTVQLAASLPTGQAAQVACYQTCQLAFDQIGPASGEVTVTTAAGETRTAGYASRLVHDAFQPKNLVAGATTVAAVSALSLLGLLLKSSWVVLQALVAAAAAKVKWALAQLCLQLRLWEWSLRLMADLVRNLPVEAVTPLAVWQRLLGVDPSVGPALLIRFYTLAVETARQYLSATEQLVALSQLGGATLNLTGRLSAAAEALRDAYALLRHVPGPLPDLTVLFQSLNQLGQTYLDAGRLGNAWDLLTKARDVLQTGHAAASPGAQASLHLGLGLLGVGYPAGLPNQPVTRLSQASQAFASAEMTGVLDTAAQRLVAENRATIMTQLTRAKHEQAAWIGARLEDCPAPGPLYLGQTYTLTTGLSWSPGTYAVRALLPLPAPAGLDEPLQFQVLVTGLEALPEGPDDHRPWERTLTVTQTAVAETVQFKLVPRVVGRQPIRIDYLHRLHWLKKIELEVVVKLKVGLLLGGGLEDQAVYRRAREALEAARGELDLECEFAEAREPADGLPALRRLIAAGCHLLLAAGPGCEAALAAAAAEAPAHCFAMLDGEVTGENVWSAVFDETAADQLLGALAGLLASPGQVGFLGGERNAVTEHIREAFEQGVAAANPRLTVLAAYADTFADEAAGRTCAQNLYAGGVEILFTAAGRSGLGAVDAAWAAGKALLSTDGDQAAQTPDVILAGRVKRLEQPIHDVVWAVYAGHFAGGLTARYDLTNQGVCLTGVSEPLLRRFVPDEPRRLAILQQLGDWQAAVTQGVGQAEADQGMFAPLELERFSETAVLPTAAAAEYELAPLAVEDDPLDLALRIYPAGAFFEAQVLAPVGAGVAAVDRFPIELTVEDVRALNKSLQKAAAAASAAEAPEALAELVEAGRHAFVKVFGQAGAETRRWLSDGQSRSISLIADLFSLPWELLYAEPADGPLAYANFWGFRHVVSRLFDDNHLAHVASDIRLTQPLRLGLLTDDSLPSVQRHEKPFFERLQVDRKIALETLPELSDYTVVYASSMAKLEQFLHKPFQVIHFACHAAYQAADPAQSYLRVTKEFDITLRKLELSLDARDLSAARPLVVLNACETGNVDPGYTAWFARVFLKRGARGVVATQCALPDAFAADFAEQLYAGFLAGQTLGEALRAARRYFLDRAGNPTGLLYALYARATTRLVKE